MQIDIGTLSGEIADDYIGITDQMGVHRMCRPMFAFPLAGRPSKNWVTKYKDKFFALYTFEKDNRERMFFLGLIPIEGSNIPSEGLENSTFLLSEKFRLWFDDENNKTIWDSLESGLLLLGDKDVTEKAVLGDKLKTKLDTLCDKAKGIADKTALLTVNTSVGPSSVPTNAVDFTTLSADIATLKSGLNEILSELVKLK